MNITVFVGYNEITEANRIFEKSTIYSTKLNFRLVNRSFHKDMSDQTIQKYYVNL